MEDFYATCIAEVECGNSDRFDEVRGMFFVSAPLVRFYIFVCEHVESVVEGGPVLVELFLSFAVDSRLWTLDRPSVHYILYPADQVRKVRWRH